MKLLSLLYVCASLLSAEPADSTAASSHIIRDQLSMGRNYYPENVEFFPEAVKELGFFRAVLAYFDRTVRSTTIGSVSYPRSRRGKDGKIHEGVEAYRKRQNERK